MKLTKYKKKQIKKLLKKYFKQPKGQEMIYFIENYNKIINA